MAVVLRKFTNPSNTQVIYDSIDPPETVATTVFTKAAVQAPSINGNNNYIWSPSNEIGQTVTFRSNFFIKSLPLEPQTVPICVFFTYVASETAAISAILEIIDEWGNGVQSFPIFTYSIDGIYRSVETFSGEVFLKSSDILGKNICITVDATVTIPKTNSLPAISEYYLGEITVHAVIENKKMNLFKKIKNWLFQHRVNK